MLRSDSDSSRFGKVLLTGSSGQVGGTLLPLLAPRADVVAPTREMLDLRDAEQIRAVVRSLHPRWIVHPAAYTAVDRAETDSETAFAINRDAVRVLAEEAAAVGAGMIHFSTDYVFSGAGEQPWREADATAPLNVYGASKRAGEVALADTGASYLNFRTSWVYSAAGKNFLLTMRKLAAEREELRVVDDQVGSPTAATDLAALTVHAMEAVEARAVESGGSAAEAMRRWTGTYHAAGTGYTSWFGFAREIVAQMREKHPESRWAQVVAVGSDEFQTPAKRPQNSRLDTGKLERELGFRFPAWQASVRRVLNDLE